VALLDTRKGAGYLFFAVVLGQVILISTQVNTRVGVPILETVVFGAFAEVQRVVSLGVSGVRRTWNGYVGLRRVSAENEDLKRQLARLQVELQQQRALGDRTRGLERLLDLRDHTSLSMTAAEIIAAGATPDFRTVTLDKGTRHGLRANMAVISPQGVVGRIVVASLQAAKVQLLIDRNAAAGAIIARSRAQGIVVGEGSDQLRLEYVSEVADIATGDVVMTSGIDGIFPKGFIIGRVDAVERNGGAYGRILVRPGVDFRMLEEVLVVLTPPGERGSSEESRE
jgi:rod shape-determining protein MreC